MSERCAFCGGRMIWWTFDPEIPLWRLCEDCDLPEGAILRTSSIPARATHE